MATKHFHTLIRLARFGVDEKRRELGVLIAREQAIEDEDARLDAEMVSEQQAAKDNPETAYAYPTYHQAYMYRKDHLRQLRRAVAEAILQAREALAEAYTEQKTYELAQEARDKAEQLEADRKEQDLMNEIGQNQFRRKDQV